MKYTVRLIINEFSEPNTVYENTFEATNTPHLADQLKTIWQEKNDSLGEDDFLSVLVTQVQNEKGESYEVGQDDTSIPNPLDVTEDLIEMLEPLEISP